MEIETTPVQNVPIVLFLALSINLNYQNYGYNHSNQCRIICGRQVRQHRIQQQRSAPRSHHLRRQQYVHRVRQRQVSADHEAGLCV